MFEKKILNEWTESQSKASRIARMFFRSQFYVHHSPDEWKNFERLQRNFLFLIKIEKMIKIVIAIRNRRNKAVNLFINFIMKQIFQLSNSTLLNQ